jgi:hypothetical protein
LESKLIMSFPYLPTFYLFYLFAFIKNDAN